MFGVDELMKEGGADDTELDYKKFLGATVGGEWQPEEEGDEDEEKEVQLLYYWIISYFITIFYFMFHCYSFIFILVFN